MKEKLSRKESCIGVSIMFFCPQIVEMVGYLGFDWILLDCEHGSIDSSELESMAIAGRAAGLSVIVRPPSNRPADIIAAMDKGADGVQIPHITDATQAANAVKSVKFYPSGNRTLAVGTRSSRYGIGMDLDEFVNVSNKKSIVILQIEDKEAVDNLDDILQTENVDVFFVGPSDLSQSLGYPGKANESPVREVIDKLFKDIHSKGLVSGTAGNPQSIKSLRSRGISYLYTHTNSLLSEGSKGIID